MQSKFSEFYKELFITLIAVFACSFFFSLTISSIIFLPEWYNQKMTHDLLNSIIQHSVSSYFFIIPNILVLSFFIIFRLKFTFDFITFHIIKVILNSNNKTFSHILFYRFLTQNYYSLNKNQKYLESTIFFKKHLNSNYYNFVKFSFFFFLFLGTSLMLFSIFKENYALSFYLSIFCYILSIPLIIIFHILLFKNYKNIIKPLFKEMNINFIPYNFKNFNIKESNFFLFCFNYNIHYLEYNNKTFCEDFFLYYIEDFLRDIIRNPYDTLYKEKISFFIKSIKNHFHKSNYLHNFLDIEDRFFNLIDSAELDRFIISERGAFLFLKLFPILIKNPIAENSHFFIKYKTQYPDFYELSNAKLIRLEESQIKNAMCSFNNSSNNSNKVKKRI